MLCRFPQRFCRFFALLLISMPAGGVAYAEEGPMLEVTADLAPIQVTERGATREIGTVPKGTRLWAFDTNDQHFRVMDPQTKQKGWIWNRHASPVEYSDRQQQNLDAAQEAFAEARELYDDGEFAAALPVYQKCLNLAFLVAGELEPLTSDAFHGIGNCHFQLGQYAEAKPVHQRALKIRLDLFGEDDEFTGYSLESLAEVDAALGEVASAESLYQRVLKIRERVLGPEHETTILTVENFAHFYANARMYAKAIPFYNRSLQVRRKMHGENHTDTAWALNGLGYVYDELDDNVRAEDFYGKALAIQIQLFGEDHEDNADVIESLARVALEQRKFVESESSYRRALEIRRKLSGDEHEDLAYSYTGLAAVYEARAEYRKAEEMYSEALRLREARLPKNDPLIAQSLNWLGWIKLEVGDYTQAEVLCRRALELREQLGELHEDTSDVLINLGAIYEGMGEYAGAEAMYLRAKNISTKLFGEEHLQTTWAWNALGSIYGMIGEYARAETYLKKNLAINRRELGDDHESTINALTNLGWLYERMGELQKAVPYYDESYVRCLKVLGEDHPTTAIARVNLSINCRETGDFAKAETLLKQALESFRATYGQEHFRVGETLQYLGMLYVKAGDYPQAEEALNQSVAIYRRILGETHPYVATNEGLLSAVYAAQGDYRRATQLCEQSRRSVRRHMVRTLPGLSQKSQQKYLAANFRRDFVSALSLGLHQKDDPRAATLSAGWLLNGKGVAQEVLAEAALLSTSEAAPFVRELRDVRNEISKLAIQRSDQDETERREQLADLESRQQRLQRQIGDLGLGLNKEDPWISASALRGQLPFDSVFVSFARFEIADVTSGTKTLQPARYVAWIVPAAGSGQIRVVDLGLADAIDQQVASLRKRMQAAIGDVSGSNEVAAETTLQKELKDVSVAILHPLEAAFADAGEIIWCPDGELWNIPWNALLMQDGRYLVEQFRTRCVLSGRELVDRLPERAAVSEPVLFADPDFNLSSGDVDTSDVENRYNLRFASTAKFPRLAASAAEAVAIKPSVEDYTRIGARVLMQRDAQEAAFKNLHRPRVLLLSTHGFFQEAPQVEPDDKRDAGAFGNPLLRCGLALAGCNNRMQAIEEGREDGILTGLEIVGTDLRGTELVVLSACETGLGDIRNGEGVAGLRQAFQLAGAQSVVSSLWQVEDGATARLMNDFFRNIATGMNKSEALRHAQLSRIKTRRDRFGAAHPFFWAAFTLTGQQ